MDINIEQALHNLLTDSVSADEIELLKKSLVGGQISIGGNVRQSVIVLGGGNTVYQLTPEALDRLNARPLLGDLERDLTGDEIVSGLNRLESELPLRAPVLLIPFQEQARRLRPSLKTASTSLSEQSRKERVEALARVNSLCMESLDISFNALCLGEEPPEYDSRSPFRGLESFRPENSEFFFGRETLTKKLVEKIQSHPFLAVIGASGSGKSSLVMAGLIPSLGSEYVIFRPGTNPLEALETAQGKSLIVVDQFEELFTLTRDESTRKDFIDRLLDESTRARIILTLRSDFLGEVGAYRTLSGEIQNHLEIIPPMDMDKLRHAMEGQAGVVGLRFEADLSQQILDDVAGEPGAMPLLQHALWVLWNRRHGRNLRASEYRAFGGVKQAIASTAEAVYARCSEFECERLRDIFLRLTRLDESSGGRDTRHLVLLRDLIPADTDPNATILLVKQLADARLVVVSDDKVEVAHEALIRHWERLRTWLNDDRDNLRLREGVTNDARRWENAAREESLLNHRGPRLELALAMSKKLRYRLNPVEQAYLNECASLKARDIKAKETLRRRIMVGLAMVLVLVGIVIYQTQETKQQTRISRSRELAFQSAALRDTNFPLSTLLGIEAYKTLDTAQSLGVLLNNIQASDHFRQYLSVHTTPVHCVAFSPVGKILASGSEDGTIILWELGESSPSVKHSIKQTSAVLSLAFSPDGKILASGNKDHTIILFDVSSGNEILKLNGHTNAVESVVFSADGKILASAGMDNAIYLWDIKGERFAQHVHTIGIRNGIKSIAISPNGKILAVSSVKAEYYVPVISNKLITSYGIELGELDTSLSTDVNQSGTGAGLSGPTDYALSVAFSPNGKMVASGGADDNIFLWDISEWNVNKNPPLDFEKTPWLLEGHADSVLSVAFSPVGKILASGSSDNSIILWDVASGQAIGKPLSGHTDPVNNIAFSPDGNFLASSGDDNVVILWDVSPQSWIEKDCQSVGRNFTSEEWKRYFPHDKYRATCSQFPLSSDVTAESAKIKSNFISLGFAVCFFALGWASFRLPLLRMSSNSAFNNSDFTGKYYFILAVTQSAILMFLFFLGLGYLEVWGRLITGLLIGESSLLQVTIGLLIFLPLLFGAGVMYSHYTRAKTGKFIRLKRTLMGGLAGFCSAFLFCGFVLYFLIIQILFLGSVNQGVNNSAPEQLVSTIILFGALFLIVSILLGSMGFVFSSISSSLYIFGIQKWTSKPNQVL